MCVEDEGENWVIRVCCVLGCCVVIVFVSIVINLEVLGWRVGVRIYLSEFYNNFEYLCECFWGLFYVFEWEMIEKLIDGRLGECVDKGES